MTAIICPNRKDEQYKELVRVLGSPEMAHLVWNRNGGNTLDFNPNGFKSTLFDQLLEHTNNDRFEALRLKAQYYLENNPNGKWYENFKVEPVLPYTTLYRGEGTREDAKLPEWAKTNAGQWFSTSLGKAQSFAKDRQGKIYTVSIPTNILEQFKAPEGNPLDEYLIPQEIQSLYNKEEYRSKEKDVIENLLNRLSEKFGYNWVYNENLKNNEAGKINLDDYENPTIEINPSTINLHTPIHEFAHIFIAAVQRDNPKLYDKLVQELKLHSNFDNIWKAINENYPSLDFPIEAQTVEAIVHVIEMYGNDMLDHNTGLFKAISEFWEYIKKILTDAFGISRVIDLKPTTSLAEIAYIITNPDIKLDLGNKLTNEEIIYLYNTNKLYSRKIKVERKLEEKKELTVDDIVQKLTTIGKDIIKEEDLELQKSRGRYYYLKDGSKEYLKEVTTQMGKFGYGYFGKSDSIYANVGSTIHESIDNIRKNIIKDISKEYGVTLTSNAKEELATIFKDLKGDYTALTEVRIADLERGVVGTIDLILISPDGKVLLYDFKTKLRRYTIGPDGEGKLSPSGFIWWNKASAKGFNDKDKAHLQLSIYAHMVEKVLGIDVNGIAVVKIEAHSNDDGKTIHTVQLYMENEVEKVESYYNKRGDVAYHHSTQSVYYGDSAALHNKSIENLERERNDVEEELFQKLSTPESKGGKLLQDLKTDLAKRVQFARKRYDASKREELENLVDLLQEEESVTNALYEIIIYASSEVFDIVDEVNKYLKEGKPFTPGLLYRWKDAVQGFKNLSSIKQALYTNPELVPKKKYLQALTDTLDQIERLETLYKTEGRYLIAKWLTPYYNGIKVQFEDVYKAEYRKLKYREVKKGKKSLDQFESDYGSIDDYVNTKIDSKKIENDTFDLLYKELEIAGRDIGEVTRWIDNMLDTSDPISGALVHAFMEAEEKSRLEAIDKKEDMSDMLETLQLKHHKALNTSEEEFYSFLLEHDDNGKPNQYILRPYRSQFFIDVEEERKKYSKEDYAKQAINTAVAQFKSQFSTFNDDEFREALYDKIAELFTSNEMDQEEYNTIRQLLDISERFYLSDLERIEGITDKTRNALQYWFKKNRPLFYDYDIKYINKEWYKFMDLLGIDKKLSMYKQVQEVRKSDNIYAKFYTAIEDVSREANQMIPYGYRIYDRLPGVAKLNSERLKAGESPLSIAKNTFKTDLFVKPEDTERGNSEWQTQDGRVKYYIPINYTSKIDAIDQSYDIAGIYFKFWESANDFKNKREILPELEMTRFFVNQRKAYNVNTFGKILSHSLGVDPEKKTPSIKDNTIMAEMFNDWFEMALYGKMSKDLKNPIKLNDKLAFDPMKFVDALNRYTSLNLLSMNLVQGFANVTMGEVMQTIEVIAHEYVDPKTYSKALLKYDQFLPGVLADVGRNAPQSLGSLIYEEFNVLDDKITDTTFSRNSKMGRVYSKTSTFAMQQMGEHWLQNRFLLAMLLKKQMVDLNGNKIGSVLDQYVKVNNKLQLKQKAELSSEDYQKFLKKNNWTEKEQVEYKMKIRGILSRMHGEYSDLGRVAIQRIALGRMAYMFRKFVVPGWRRRWGRPQYIERLGQYTEGNYITFLKFFRNYYKEIGTLQFAVMGENWAGLSDHEKANIRRTISEATFLLAAFIVAGFAFKMKGDDPEDEWLWSFLSYQSYRLKSELFFFSSPGNAMQILRSPMASMSVLQNIGDLATQLLHPTEVYKRGPMKGELKLKKDIINFIPIYKQFYRARDIEQQISWFNRSGSTGGNFQ